MQLLRQNGKRIILIIVYMFQLVTDPERPVIFYEWTDFLARLFRKLPSLLSYHHFRCDVDYPGSILVRSYADDVEREIKLLKTGVTVQQTVLPDITINPGLDAARQWYLYDEVRPCCPSQIMDKVCPKPAVPKSVLVVKEEKKKKK